MVVLTLRPSQGLAAGLAAAVLEKVREPQLAVQVLAVKGTQALLVFKKHLVEVAVLALLVMWDQVEPEARGAQA